MLGLLDSVSFFAEAGISRPALGAVPGDYRAAFSSVGCLRPARTRTPARLFVSGLFASSRAVQRFWNMDPGAVLPAWPQISGAEEGLAAYPHLHQDLHEALRLLAARVSARGTSRAVRQRSGDQAVEQSPSYALVFATERLLSAKTRRSLATVQTSAGSSGSTRSTPAGESWPLSASTWKKRA